MRKHDMRPTDPLHLSFEGLEWKILKLRQSRARWRLIACVAVATLCLALIAGI
jgi:hypothetical protein